MFFDLSIGKILVLAVIALVVFGPDQLPKMASQAGRTLRELRRMADGATRDLREGLGPEFSDFDVRDLHPGNFVRKHLFDGLDSDYDGAGPGRRNPRASTWPARRPPSPWPTTKPRPSTPRPPDPPALSPPRRRLAPAARGSGAWRRAAPGPRLSRPFPARRARESGLTLRLRHTLGPGR